MDKEDTGLTLATFNVNSIRARLQQVLDWVDLAGPDILLLQELKCEAAEFPTSHFAERGYQSLICGQKSWNGVAILSRRPVSGLVTDRLPGDSSDEQARYLEVEIDGLRIASVYLPNGNPADGPKYLYKLAWMARLEAHAHHLLRQEIPFVLGGDFNVIPEAGDASDPGAWVQDALYLPTTRAAWRRLIHLGLTDALRAVDPATGCYTFWDYQGQAFARDHGIRIDHFLLSPTVADRLVGCAVDRGPRALDKPSDHTPVVLTLSPA